ncbi:hypothetical protein [Fluviispira multicolorata]|uniref:Uncharacterized protein n=1 Tax=Fluviispira multicolorata TaxID=2654512 RepID=A0A833N543_9BACT|nr:hypothetical protein [Fluviispira multicolorata]KAB8032123.1 hypothetical protein GCL57_05605 [Fluviispira multicolorata]
MRYSLNKSDLLINNKNNYIFGFSYDELLEENIDFSEKILSKNQYILNINNFNGIKNIDIKDYQFYCTYDKEYINKEKQYVFLGTKNIKNSQTEILCKGLFLPFLEENITAFSIQKSGMNLGLGISKNLMLFTDNLSGCILYLLFSNTHTYVLHSNLKDKVTGEVDLTKSDIFVNKISKILNCYKIKKLDKSLYLKGCEHLREDNVLSTFACMFVKENNFFTKDDIHIFYQTVNLKGRNSKILLTGLI